MQSCPQSTMDLVKMSLQSSASHGKLPAVHCRVSELQQVVMLLLTQGASSGQCINSGTILRFEGAH